MQGLLIEMANFWTVVLISLFAFACLSAHQEGSQIPLTQVCNILNSASWSVNCIHFTVSPVDFRQHLEGETLKFTFAVHSPQGIATEYAKYLDSFTLNSAFSIRIQAELADKTNFEAYGWKMWAWSGFKSPENPNLSRKGAELIHPLIKMYKIEVLRFALNTQAFYRFLKANGIEPEWIKPEFIDPKAQKEEAKDPKEEFLFILFPKVPRSQSNWQVFYTNDSKSIKESILFYMQSKVQKTSATFKVNLFVQFVSMTASIALLVYKYPRAESL